MSTNETDLFSPPTGAGLTLTDADIGKQFRRRDGKVITLMRSKRPSAPDFPYQQAGGCYTFDRNGYWLDKDNPTSRDLVERITPFETIPATEAVVRGPLVITSTPTVVDSPIAIGDGKFVTKDSGERQEFTSGMKRDTSTGKMRPDLIKAGPMYLRWVMLLTRGATKYGPNNWLKAEGDAERDRFLESAQRHFDIWYHWRKYGINIEDPDNPTTDPISEDHAAGTFFNINGVEYVSDKLEAAA